MARIALTFEDTDDKGTVKADTIGPVYNDTPAATLSWAAMYMVGTPQLMQLLMPQITAFRNARLEEEKAMIEKAKAEEAAKAAEAAAVPVAEKVDAA